VRVLVYEHFTHLGAGRAPKPLLRAGGAMARAVMRDLSGLPGIRVHGPGRGHGRRSRIRAREAARALAAADATLLIAPESGRTLERLAARAARTSALLLGPGPRSIRLAADKVLCGRMLRAAGVATPAPAAAVRNGAAIVVKPRRGCGSEGVVVARGAAARRRARRHAAGIAGRDGVLLEEFVSGATGSASFLVRAGGAADRPGDLLSLGLGRQRMAGRARLVYRGGALPWAPAGASAAEAMAARALAALARASGDLRGFVGVDFVLGPRGPVIVDINPRLTSSYLGLRRRFGPALARAMLQAARGERLPRRLRGRGRARFLAGGDVRFDASAAARP
jgi:predicted ATP-grasp superfamily ATP-dependent carboligase